jgi:hypothetical protein
LQTHLKKSGKFFLRGGKLGAFTVFEGLDGKQGCLSSNLIKHVQCVEKVLADCGI